MGWLKIIGKIVGWAIILELLLAAVYVIWVTYFWRDDEN